MNLYPVYRQVALLGDKALSEDAASIGLSDLDLTGWRIVRLMALLKSATGEGGSSGDWTRTILRLNGSSTAADYRWSVVNSDATHVNNSDVGYAAGIVIGHMAGPNAEADTYGVCTCDFILPGDAGLKKALTISAAHPDIPDGVGLGTTGCGYYLHTDPITQVDIVANDGDDIVAGSRLLLIGLV